MTPPVATAFLLVLALSVTGGLAYQHVWWSAFILGLIGGLIIAAGLLAIWI